MTVYTKKEYCDKYGISHDTLERRVKDHNLPTWQTVKPLDGRGFVIIVDHCKLCEDTEKACIEYNKRCGRSIRPDIAAELSVKYQINTAKLFRVLGI